MKKPLRRTKLKGRSHTNVPAPRRVVTRREYAEVVLRLGSVERQAQQNRAAIELQAQRIIQLQEQLNAVATAAPPHTVSAEIPELPMTMTAPTVES
jgi:hypothetical protein